MSHKSPNHVQVALLYEDSGGLDLRALLEAFLRIESQGFDNEYKVIEFDQEAYFRCYGGREIMVFVEKIDEPANGACFNDTLGSVFTNLLSPDARTLIDRHRTHVLINVQNGLIPPDPKAKELCARLGIPEAGQSLPEYHERLRVLGALTAIATQLHAPLLSHWTHSDMLVDPAKLGEMMLDSGPSPLHIHPFPYRAPASFSGVESEMGAKQEEAVGLVTHGVSYFIGRELRVRPNSVPWMENFRTALIFVKIAIKRNGYIIPDGDTFGDEENTICYRVHHEAKPLRNGPLTVPCYELELLRNQEHGFVAPDYIPRDYTVDLDGPRTVDPDDPRKPEVMEEWTSKRRMAERAGMGFEVKVDMRKTGAQGQKPFGRRSITEAKSKGALGWVKERLFH